MRLFLILCFYIFPKKFKLSGHIAWNLNAGHAGVPAHVGERKMIEDFPWKDRVSSRMQQNIILNFYIIGRLSQRSFFLIPMDILIGISGCISGSENPFGLLSQLNHEKP